MMLTWTSVKGSTSFNFADRFSCSVFIHQAQTSTHTGFIDFTGFYLLLMYYKCQFTVPHSRALNSFALRIAYTNNYCSHSFHSLSTSLFPSVSDFLSVRRVKQHDWAGQFPVNARLPLPHTHTHTHTQGVAPKKPSADFTDPLQGATKSCALPDTFLHNDLTWPKMTRGCQGSYWAGGERDRWRDNEKD